MNAFAPHSGLGQVTIFNGLSLISIQGSTEAIRDKLHRQVTSSPYRPGWLIS
jgi:hypothetical protein